MLTRGRSCEGYKTFGVNPECDSVIVVESLQGAGETVYTKEMIKKKKGHCKCSRLGTLLTDQQGDVIDGGYQGI